MLRRVGPLVALLAVVASIVAIVVVPSEDDDPDASAAEILRADARDLATASRVVDGADTLAELRDAGETSQALARRIRDRETAISALDDDETAEVAAGAHRRTLTVVSGYGRLAALGDGDLEQWADGAPALLAAADELRQRSARDAILSASSYLRDADRRLDDWRLALDGYERRRARAVEDAARYRARVRRALATYGRTRDRLARYVEDQAAAEGDVIEFRFALERSRRTRERVRRRLESASALAPGRARGEHEDLVTMLDDAIRACDLGMQLADEAALGVFDRGTTDLDPAGYEGFRRLAADLDEAHRRRARAWTASLAGYVRALGGDPPKRPRV